MTTDTSLARARASFAARAWAAAADAYAAADGEAPLELDDLERAGLAAQLSGDDGMAARVWTRAHRTALVGRDPLRAARFAFRLGMMLADTGDMVVAGGWLARAGRLVEEHGRDCVERGYLLVPQAIGTLDAGDAATALAQFGQAADIADRFADEDLATLARLGRGRSLIALGEVERGIALLDEAMVALTAGEASPVITGVVYCGSIEGFREVFDLRRAQDWTEALSRWCEAQPELVPFRGRCLVYRAELMRLHGAWREASEEARRATEWLLGPPPVPAAGEALYQQAELHRLRGELDAAEAAYRAASGWGRRPEPGLALLRLVQGQTPAALAMIRRAVGEASSDVARAALLDPLVEIALAAGDVAAARAAADELGRTADMVRAPALEAVAARAAGVVRLADGNPEAALHDLRRSAAAWQAVEAPYEHARVRVALARALRELGDADTADIELEAARRVFGELGAAPDLARLDAPARRPADRPGGLSVREVEVLRLLARGLTNRAIAVELVISERTVDRHVSNIYAKLGVASRSAATAFAYEHGLVAG